MPQIRLTILDPTIAREFDVPLGITIIGRELSINLPIPNPQVSRRHAQLISDGQICELVDLGSANGTFINDERLIPQAPKTLEDGMRLRFGPVEVSVQIIPDAPVAEPEPPVDETSIPVGDLPVGAPREAPSHAVEEPQPAETSEPPEEEPAEMLLDLPVEPSTPERAVPDGSSSPLPPQQEDAPVGARPDALSDTGITSDTSSPSDSADTPPDSPAPSASAAETSSPTVDQPVPPVKHASRAGKGAQPPNRPPSSTPWLDDANLPANPFDLPGLSIYSRHLINQLPGIYQTDFMARFLGIFESIQTPIEWTVDGFDLYLDPDSSPAAFLSWLGSWFGLTFDASWSEAQRRTLIAEAHAIFARRGTRWALARILQIYTGREPQITDTGDGIEPFNFRVRLAMPDTSANRTLLTRLIDAHKPAYTTYRLELTS